MYEIQEWSDEVSYSCGMYSTRAGAELKKSELEQKHLEDTLKSFNYGLDDEEKYTKEDIKRYLSSFSIIEHEVIE